MIKRFLAVAASTVLLAGAAWLTVGSSTVGAPPADDPNSPCSNCW